MRQWKEETHREKLFIMSTLVKRMVEEYGWNRDNGGPAGDIIYRLLAIVGLWLKTQKRGSYSSDIMLIIKKYKREK